eukprot:748457-Hanusia_phi.AAC.6
MSPPLVELHEIVRYQRIGHALARFETHLGHSRRRASAVGPRQASQTGSPSSFPCLSSSHSELTEPCLQALFLCFPPLYFFMLSSFLSTNPLTSSLRFLRLDTK